MLLISIVFYLNYYFPPEFVITLLKFEMLEKSSFHNIGESITFLSGDFTEKINPNTKSIVIKIIVITNLSDRLFINLV